MCLIKGQKESVSQCRGGTKGASEKKNEQRQREKNPKTAQDFVLSTCFYFPPTLFFFNPLLFLPLKRVHCFLQESLLHLCVQINEGFHLETDK